MAGITGRASQGGQALVEFALVLTVFLVLFFGVVDLGRAVFAYVTLNQASSAAARAAIVDQNPTTDCTTSPDAWACAGRRDSAFVGNDVTFAASYLRYDYTVDGSGRSVPTGCGPVALDCVVQVTATWHFGPITPVIGALFPGGFTISTTSELPVERLWCSSPVDAATIWPSGPCPTS